MKNTKKKCLESVKARSRGIYYNVSVQNDHHTDDVRQHLPAYTVIAQPSGISGLRLDSGHKELINLKMIYVKTNDAYIQLKSSMHSPQIADHR